MEKESKDVQVVNLAAIDEKFIRERIYTNRGVQVMLDSDLAELFHVETKRINESVKRNPKRFPGSFCFELTKEEYKGINLKSQDATSNGRGGRRTLPIWLSLMKGSYVKGSTQSEGLR